MKNLLITAAVIAALVAGVRALLEHKAAHELEVATEMYEDYQCDEALAKLRTLDEWLPWTQAAKDSEKLRKKVRARLTQVHEQQAADREMRQRDAEDQRQRNWEAQEERQREQFDRQMELQRDRLWQERNN